MQKVQHHVRSSSMNEITLVGINNEQYVDFIRYLDESEKEQDILKTLANLRSQKKSELMKFDCQSCKYLAKICNKYASILLLSKRQEKEALELLEFTQTLLSSPTIKSDIEAQDIKQAIRNNLATYAYAINDKALGMKFLESAARGDRGARPEIKALIYQNLSLVCLSQKQYTNAIGYSKEALNLIKPLVLEPIKKKINHLKLRADKTFKSNLMIMLNIYITKAIIIEKTQNNSSQHVSDQNEINPIVANMTQLERGYDYSKLFLGESHILTKKFKLKIDAIKETKGPEPLFERPKSKSDPKKVLSRFSLQSPFKLKTEGDSSRSPKQFKPLNFNGIGQTAGDRLISLLDSNRGNGASSRDASDVSLYSSEHTTSATQLKGFRIRRSSLSGLQIFTKAVQEKDHDRPESSRLENPQRDISDRTSLSGGTGLNHSISEGGFSRRSRNHSINSSRILQDNASPMSRITTVGGAADEGSLIKKNLESILRNQAEFENKFSRKIENVLANAHKPERFEKTVAQKELELQIELLKQANEKVLQEKLAKELELEQLRAHIALAEPQLKNPSMTSLQFPMPSLSQFYNPYPSLNTLNNSHQYGNILYSPSGNGPSNLRPHSLTDNAISHGPYSQRPQQMKSSILRVPNRKQYDRQESHDLIKNLESNQRDFIYQGSGMFDSPVLTTDPPEQDVLINAKLTDSSDEWKKRPEILKPQIHRVEGNFPQIKIPTTEEEDEKSNEEVKSNNFARQDSESEPKFQKKMSQEQVYSGGGKNPIIIVTKEPDPIGPQPANYYSIDYSQVDELNELDENGNLRNRPSSIIIDAEPPRKIGKFFHPQSRTFQLDFTKLEKKPRDDEAPRAKVASDGNTNSDIGAPQANKDSKLQIQTKPLVKLNKSVSLTPNAIKTSAGKVTAEIETTEEATKVIKKAASLSGQQVNALAENIQKNHEEQKQEPHGHRVNGETTPANNHISSQLKFKKEIELTKATSGPDQLITLSSLFAQLESAKLPKKLSIRKQLALIEDSYTYMVECKLEDRGEDPTLEIILSQKALTHDEFFSLDEERIKLKEFKKVLEVLEYRDIIPNHLNLRSIDSMESLIKNIVVPFVGISIDAEQNRKIEIWKNAPSLLRGLPEIRFLDEDCYLSLHHVAHTDFRVVLSHASTGIAMRFDLNMDESSFAKYFEWMPLMKSQTNPVEDLVSLINVAEDEESTGEELQDVAKLIKKYQDVDNVDHELPSCQIRERKQEELLLEFIGKSIIQIQTLLVDKNINNFEKACEMSSQFKYYKMRVFEEFKRVNFSMLLESNMKQGIEIYLKNFYETHAPNTKKIKAEGNSFYSFDSVWKDFALSYNRLNQDDKYAVYALISECYKLQTHDKPLAEDDFEMYEENPIVHIPVDHGPFSRIFIGESYKYPVVTELVGIKGHPVGVKSYLYDCYECAEKGVFFYLDSQLWKLKEDPNVKKRVKRHIIALPMIDQYHFEGVLKSKGFEIIGHQLIFNETPLTCELVGVRSAGTLAQSESLEKILSFSNFVKYYKETNETWLLDI